MSGVEKIKDLPEKVSSPENAEGIGHHGLSQRTFQAFRSGTGRRRKEYGRKGRREKMNVYIQELVNLLPGLQEYERLDKAIILKNTIDFIKFHNDSTVDNERINTISSLKNEVGQLLFKGYHAFLFVISLSGKFTFLSECISNILGHTKGDLIDKNIYDYIYPEDKIILMKQLSKHGRTRVARNSAESSSFHIRFKANIDGKPFYETLFCCGYFCVVNNDQSNDDDTVMESSNETCFVSVLAKPIKLNYLLDVSSWRNTDLVEFTSRQDLGGKFVYVDDRCIPITGYFPRQILGSMLCEFIHFDDLEHTRTSFEKLLEDGKAETGHYRFLTEGCQWILIKTKSYISYNHWNYRPEFICSTHKLVSFRSNANAGALKETEESPM